MNTQMLAIFALGLNCQAFKDTAPAGSNVSYTH